VPQSPSHVRNRSARPNPAQASTHTVDHAWLRVPALPATARRQLADTALSLRHWLTAPEVREAMWIASPSLAAEIDGYLAAPDTARGRRAELSLIRYLVRMSSRATPFGGFAAVAPAELGETTRIALAPRNATRRLTRIDGAILGELTAALARDPELRAGLPHRMNTSAYRIAEQLRYAEQRFIARFVSYRLAAVDVDDVLLDLQALASTGVTPSALAEQLAARHPEFPREDVDAFVDAAIDEQVLVPELAPSPTCDEPLAQVIGSLRRCPGQRAATACTVLEDVAARIARLDAGGFAGDLAPYREIQDALEGAQLVADASAWWQVDAARTTVDARIGPTIVAEVERVVALLHRLAPAAPQEPLEEFRARFEQRYGDREVPLGEALDEENGIGFAAVGAIRDVAPLLVGLPGLPVRTADGTFTRRDAHLFRRLRALPEGAELVLDDADLLALTYTDRPPPLPDGIAVIVEIAAVSSEAVDRGEFSLHLDNASGPSSARILGRFGHVCPPLAELGRRHTAAEAALRPEAVFAEIVHLPEGRANNVVMRARMREHEIALLARPSVADEHCSTIDDLRVSVRNGAVVLRSHRLGREVVPRLSCTHNYRGRALGIYGFLCALQGQGLANLWFDWGAASSSERLPRVRHGNTVLARARWNIPAEPLATLAAARRGAKHAVTPGELDELRARTFEAMQALRRRTGLPRHVTLVDHDNMLPVDLDDAAEVEAFVAIVKDRPRIALEERTVADDEVVVDGPDGRYHAQLVVSLLRQPVARPLELAAPPRADVPRAWHRHAPGSSWAYVKLYTGPSGADDLLRDTLGPWLRAAQAEGHIARWFFLRYADPDFHLRLRLRGDAGVLARDVLPSLWSQLRPWTDAGVVWRVTHDTYDPEVDRYGGPAAIDAIEDVFAVDSIAALAVQAQLGGDEELRWSAALRGLDGLLVAFGDDERTTPWVQRLRDAFVAERGDTPALRKFLTAQWRKRKDHVMAVLAEPTLDALVPALGWFARRDAVVAATAAHLRELDEAGRLSRSIESIAGSLMHMHTNRMLRADHRAQETVLYDLLLRARESRRARRGQAG